MNEPYIHSINNQSILLITEGTAYLRFTSSGERQKIKKLNVIPWWDIQIIPLIDAFIILSFGNAEILFIDANGECQGVKVPEFIFPYVNRYMKIDGDELLFDRGGLGYFKFNTLSKVYVELTSLNTRKAYPMFREAEIDLFAINHNILWQSIQSNLILYHRHRQNIDEIGIYDTSINQHTVRFTPPKKIETINWYKGVKAIDNLNMYSNVLACVYSEDSLLLCYQDVLYQIDYNGDVINQKNSSDGCRFYGLARNFDGRIYLSELNLSNNVQSLFEFGGFENAV